ncbi:MAG: peptidylprolyl isomerase [Verrucomicrobiales bacterium]|nr:peptidylprolyl isomerase [Verrucomicrobiales bacterium]
MNSRFSSLFISAAIFGCLWLLPGCRPPTSSTPSPAVLAIIGASAINTSELRAELERRASRGQKLDPQKILDELILREALVARARQLGLDQEPVVVRAYKHLLISELKRRELEPLLQSEEVDPQARSNISQERGKSALPTGVPQIRLAILRQGSHAKTSDSKIQQIEARLEEARVKAAGLPMSERGFGSLAIDYSDDQSSRYRGGDLGWLVEDASKLHYDPAMVAAAFQLKNLGELSPVIRGKDGFYLVRLLDRRIVETASHKESDAVACHREQIERRRKLEQAFEQRARASVSIEIHEENLALLADLAFGQQ